MPAMTSMPRFILPLMLALLASPLRAEPGVETAPPVEQAPQTQKTEVTGFAFELPAEVKPSLLEHSNATFYMLELRRTDAAGACLPEDEKLSFLRLTQTVATIENTDLIQQILDMTVNEAKQAIQGMELGTSMQPPVECKRVIAGAERSGIMLPLKLEDGTTNVECYAFAHEGIGIAATLKVPADAPPTDPDAALASTILENLSIKPVEPEMAYPFVLTGCEIPLPINSQVTSATRLNEYTVACEVAVPEGSLQFTVLGVPPGYAKERALQEMRTAALKQFKDEADGGAFGIIWMGPNTMPTGDRGTTLLETDTHLITTTSNPTYVTSYPFITGRYAVLAKFFCLPQNAEHMHRRAEWFFDHVGDIASTTSHPEWTTYRLPGNRLELPTPYCIWEHERAGLFDEYIISSEQVTTFDQMLDLVVNHSPITLVRFYPPDSPVDLRAAHNALSTEFKNRLNTPGAPIEPVHETKETRELALADSSNAETLSSSFRPLLDPHGIYDLKIVLDDLTVTSHWLPRPAGMPKVLVATVANELQQYDAESLSRTVIEKLRIDESAGSLDLGFATFRYDPMSAYITETPLSSPAGTAITIHLDAQDEITIRTFGPDPHFTAIADTLLASEHMAQHWRLVSLPDERDAFPASAKQLSEGTLAGHKALVFDAQFGFRQLRKHAADIRMYAFSHGEYFTSICIEHAGTDNDARIEELAAMFQPKE